MDRLIPDPETVTCPACGHENPTSHKYCGSCGATLLRGSQASSRENEREDRREELSREYDDERQDPKRDPQPFESSITNPQELSLFRSFRPSDGSDDWYEEQRSPYRIYIALVLAILIGGLAYMAWRTSKSGTQNAHEAPPAPVTTDNNPAPAANAPAKQSDANAPKSQQAANPPAAAPEKPAETAKANTTAPPAKESARPPAETAHPQTPIDNGSAELAQAQRYLGAHDNADAATWLWKSIAKHNGQATVLLADLYLKGEGVSKNCDQARVLLDSAARKGVSGAGERLRNLQAFGCQ